MCAYGCFLSTSNKRIKFLRWKYFEMKQGDESFMKNIKNKKTRERVQQGMLRIKYWIYFFKRFLIRIFGKKTQFDKSKIWRFLFLLARKKIKENIIFSFFRKISIFENISKTSIIIITKALVTPQNFFCDTQNETFCLA